jgi:starch-binding outer membrane protein, SusD/RagB family
MKYFNNIIKKTCCVIVLFNMTFVSCEEQLNKYPLDKLSKETFWKDERDASLGLVSLYNSPSGRGMNSHGLNNYITYIAMDLTVDIGRGRLNWASFRFFYGGQTTSSTRDLSNLWSDCYRVIARCNNFIENIELADISPELILEMKSEARFIRAYHFFWMVHFWGDIPLTTKTLTIDEANSIQRTPRSEVVDFILNELTEAAEYLPEVRPDAEKGRVVKAAALAIKGRMLMLEKRWTEAATVFKSIIDLGLYSIYDDYELLFTERGENNNEVIHAIKYLENDYGTEIQRYVLPFMYNEGWHMACLYNEFVESFLCTDGLPIDESPLYNVNNPFENRDPRLFKISFLDRHSVFKGQLFVSHPDSIQYPDALPKRTWSGIGVRKFADEAYTGSPTAYGGNFPLIRYAEVLLSYLECKIESGEAISQDLLDLTINQIRQRPSVNMPVVTQTNPELLREIVRNERKTELPLEGLRLFDLLRWRTAHILLGNNTRFHGVKITDDPVNYKGPYIINENGYYYFETRNFLEREYLLPIPESEMNIHQDWEQNPGY